MNNNIFQETIYSLAIAMYYKFKIVFLEEKVIIRSHKQNLSYSMDTQCSGCYNIFPDSVSPKHYMLHNTISTTAKVPILEILGARECPK